MKIRAIRLRNVKKIGDPGLAIENISDGLNVLSEPNEFGKSTIFEALRHGLLTKHSSKAEYIKTLQPYGLQVAPSVEIDIEWQGETHRISKQFLSRSSTSVKNLTSGNVILADDAQDWIKAMLGADGKHAGPTGLLWVSQGKSIESAAQDMEDQAVFTSVLDNEVTSLISGQSGRRVLAQTEKDLRNLTTKTGLPRGHYKVCKTRQSDLEAHISDIRQTLQSANADIERLTEVERQLSSYKDDDSDHLTREELKSAQSDREAALLAESEHQALISNVNSAETTLGATNESLERLIDTLESARSLNASQTQNSQELERAQITFSGLETEIDNLQKSLNAAELALNDAKAAYQRSAQEKDMRDNAKKLADITQRLSKAEPLKNEFDKLDQQIRALKVDKPNLDRLVTQHNELSTAEAVFKTSQVTAYISSEDAPEHKITIAGRPASTDTDIPITGKLTLTIDGTTHIQIKNPLGQDEDVESQYKRAKDAYEAACLKLGVTDITEARQIEAVRYDLKIQRDEANNKLGRIAPNGLENLKQEATTLTQSLDGFKDSNLSLDDALTAQNKCEAQVQYIHTQLTPKTKSAQDIQQNIAILKTRIDNERKQIADIERIHGPLEQMNQKRTEFVVALENYDKAYQVAKSKLQAFERDMPNLQMIEARIQRLQGTIDAREQKQRALEKEQTEIKARLSQIFDVGIEETLAIKEGELESINRQVAQYEAEVRALSLLHETLLAAQQTEKQKLFDPVITEIEPLARQVIPGISFKFGDDFAASEIMRDDITEKVEGLSGGTQEQIAILTRLVFARLKARQGHPTPVILDDALVFSDDARIASMFDALTAVANDVQIIVLTCRQKSFENLGGNMLQAEVWA